MHLHKPFEQSHLVAPSVAERAAIERGAKPGVVIRYPNDEMAERILSSWTSSRPARRRAPPDPKAGAYGYSGGEEFAAAIGVLNAKGLQDRQQRRERVLAEIPFGRDNAERMADICKRVGVKTRQAGGLFAELVDCGLVEKRPLDAHDLRRVRMGYYRARA